MEFLSNFNVKLPLHERKVPLLTTFWRRFWEGWPVTIHTVPLSGTPGQRLGHGRSERVEGTENYKRPNDRYHMFLFSNNIGLKHYFLGARIAAINLFQVDLHKPWNYLLHCYGKAPPPYVPQTRSHGGIRGQCPTYSFVPPHILLCLEKFVLNI